MPALSRSPCLSAACSLAKVTPTTNMCDAPQDCELSEGRHAPLIRSATRVTDPRGGRKELDVLNAAAFGRGEPAAQFRLVRHNLEQRDDMNQRERAADAIRQVQEK